MWKKFLFGLCLTIILTMAIMGKNPTVRFFATNIKMMAKYIEDITSDDKMKVKNYERLSNDKEIMADGKRAHRRRNPARTHWEAPEHEEM